LADAGYIEGRDVVIEWRRAGGNYERLPQLAADLVQSKVEVIVVDSTRATEALKRVTSSIPIVMAFVADPVGSGLVPSLAHPGGNVTGLSMMTRELSIKRLQLLKELMPHLVRVAVLWNPDTPPHRNVVQALKAAAPSLSLELTFVGVATSEQLGSAFSAIRRARSQALDVIEDGVFSAHRATIFKLTSNARLPSIWWDRQYADSALICYGADPADLLRRAAGYAAKILKGANPADLPIEQPTKLELTVNLKIASELDIAIPESILLRADEVIR
jgi:putative ABC transport system substrate-binding protein